MFVLRGSSLGTREPDEVCASRRFLYWGAFSEGVLHNSFLCRGGFVFVLFLGETYISKYCSKYSTSAGFCKENTDGSRRFMHFVEKET